eukprot:augustus_masked-scaffold_1-processed-gene-6.53-mRNA-1 protein AED:0.25 eAED:0.25 QI:0/-1/0/1/-1/1/1/0/1160
MVKSSSKSYLQDSSAWREATFIPADCYIPLCGDIEDAVGWTYNEDDDFYETERNLEYGVCCALADTEDDPENDDDDECYVNPFQSCREETVEALCEEDDCFDDAELNLELQFEVEEDPESCCLTCGCYGDPRCVSFDKLSDIWVLCDARMAANAENDRNTCVIQEEQCILETDHEERQCQWVNLTAEEEETWSVLTNGSRCLPNESSGESWISMYSFSGFDFSIRQAERGVIVEVEITLDEETFGLTSEDCYAGDFNNSWTDVEGEYIVPAPNFVQTYETLAGEYIWLVNDIETNVHVKLRCLRQVGDGGARGQPRINVESLVEPEVNYLNERENAAGFCVTSNLPKTGTTENTNSIEAGEGCDPNGANEDIEIGRLLCDESLIKASLPTCAINFCEENYFPNFDDFAECVVLIGDGTEGYNFRDAFCIAMTFTEEDLADCYALWDNEDELSGPPAAIEKYGDVDESTANDNCIDSVDELPDELTDCQNGVELQYLDEDFEWVSVKGILQDFPPCGVLTFDRDSFPELFENPVRISQCTVSSACSSAAGICEPQSGFAAKFTLVPGTPAPTQAPSDQPTEAPTLKPTSRDQLTESPTTNDPTNFPTESPTEEPTKFPTDFPTEAPTGEPTDFPTDFPTTSVPTNSPQDDDYETEYPTVSPTLYPTAYPTVFPTSSTDSPTSAPTLPKVWSVPTASPTENIPLTESPTVYPTEFPTVSPTERPTENPTWSPSAFPTTSPTQNPTESPTWSPSAFPTTDPTVSPTLYPTRFPTIHPTESPTIAPSSEPTLSPTEYPTRFPTVSPTGSPTESPTVHPTRSPTRSPTISPTEEPTVSPTESPTTRPTESPTTSPTESPTVHPTRSPTTEPTITPTESPTIHPTEEPTVSPTESPTVSPTESPTISPTESPTVHPTEEPTESPTESPTIEPTKRPTESPTIQPTKKPTWSPSMFPTPYPTSFPTTTPTESPTESPTISPTRADVLPPTAPGTWGLDEAEEQKLGATVKFSADYVFGNLGKQALGSLNRLQLERRGEVVVTAVYDTAKEAEAALLNVNPSGALAYINDNMDVSSGSGLVVDGTGLQNSLGNDESTILAVVCELRLVAVETADESGTLTEMIMFKNGVTWKSITIVSIAGILLVILATVTYRAFTGQRNFPEPFLDI